MILPSRLDLSDAGFACVLDTAPRFALAGLGLAGEHRALESSSLFLAIIDAQVVDAQTPNLYVRNVSVDDAIPGRRHARIELLPGGLGVVIDYHIVRYSDAFAIETWIVVRNEGALPRRVTRLDSLVLDLLPGRYDLQAYTGAWGAEFEPQSMPLTSPVTLESRSGRSSHGHHPWFALVCDGRSIISGAVAWSGNWAIRLMPRLEEVVALSAGLHDWEFAVDLAPGASVEAPPVVLVFARGDDLDEAAVQFARLGRRFWYPRNALADRLPVEWNHWWAYEDRALDEATFRANVDVAARIGIEVCTLDAGWFGASDAGTHWYDQRGDWEMVNAVRFPSGIRALADDVHARGMRFGIWCEIEGLGTRARLAETHPDFVAMRDGRRLGYVCLGNPAAQQWAFETLDHLIRDYGCDWIKLDFNLDPGAGCNRVDHGHGVGDGLYAHYCGYYALLDRVRATHPHVVLENCSSGGLRIDPGIARRTHMAFLSDPDWPEHSLQVFWGATQMLAPDACLHWSYCEWSFARHPSQTFNPRDPSLQPHQVDFYTRISMLRRFGFSQRLPDLPDWVAQRYADHIAFYKAVMRRFVREADMYHLTGQPLGEGRGDRWAGFQYRMPDGSEHLVAVFRLPGAEPLRVLRLKHLHPERIYTLLWVDSGQQTQASGAELMDTGLRFDDLPEEGSALVRIR